MKILIRNAGEGKWQMVESAIYNAEVELQRLLAETPSLVAIPDIRPGSSPLVAAVREVGLPGSGSTDILAFNPDGNIAIIECKLAANAEIKRKVIGQVLEYGAYLWGMTYQDLDQKVQARAGQSLADLVRGVADDPDWDEEVFREAVAKTLADGTFILVIAVDEMNEELDRTVRFLNNCGNPAFAFAALEMRRFQAGVTEILVPQVMGEVKTPPPTPGGDRKKWTEKDFFDAAEQELPATIMSIVRDLYEWAKHKADRLQWGTGKTAGTFTFYYLTDDIAASVFNVSTQGVVMLNFGQLNHSLPKVIADQFREAVVNIPSFSKLSTDTRQYPTIAIAEAFVDQPACLDHFKAAVAQLGKNIHS